MQNEGFDSVAADYDRVFTHTSVGRLQRALLHAYLEPKLMAGTAVLELNCGTGEDAVWLAREGVQVLATDISGEMVAAAGEKAGQLGLSQLVQTGILDIRELSNKRPASRFDLVLSNFGGLNCLSPAEIQTFGAILPQLLQPGGLFVAVVMGRFCWWETLYFLLKGSWSEAFRRLKTGPVHARLDAQTTMPTWYYSAAEFRRFFPNLEVKTVQPVGFWLPPTYLDSWFSKRYPLLWMLNFLEKKCRGRLWARAADHYLVVFQTE